MRDVQVDILRLLAAGKYLTHKQAGQVVGLGSVGCAAALKQLEKGCFMTIHVLGRTSGGGAYVVVDWGIIDQKALLALGTVLSTGENMNDF